MHRTIAVVFFVVALLFLSFSARQAEYEGEWPISDLTALKWVDSVFNSLSREQRIAQMIVIRAYSNKDERYNQSIEELISKYNPGGVCFFQGGPVRQAHLTNRYQAVAQTPLMISIDGEWGLSMRLDSTPYFPRQMTLGAIQDNDLIETLGKELGKQCKRIGVHLNFAPVADVNCNPANPVINSRSFGEDRENVAQKAIALMKGMQGEDVLACAKHFPGHGDTDTDSHYTLPIINSPFNIIDSIHIYPFKRLIEAGVSSIMAAHLFIPAIDSTQNLATTLSPLAIQTLLRDSLNYKGLVITDALEMKGVSDHFKAGELDVLAVIAGNDILLLPQHPETTINAVVKAIDEGRIDEAELNERCRKILAFKYLAGLADFQPIRTQKLHADLNSREAVLLNQKLYDHAITLVQNANNILPLNPDNSKIATLTIGSETAGTLENTAKTFAKTDAFYLKKGFNAEQGIVMAKKLESYDRVIVSIRNTNNQAKDNYGIGKQTIAFIKKLQAQQAIILCIFANPYSLASFGEPDPKTSILVGYQDNAYAHKAAIRIIFGEIQSRGKLPVTASDWFPLHTGYLTGSEETGWIRPIGDSLYDRLNRRIDSIALDGISQGAYPGCQVAVFYKGREYFLKSYGSTSWNEGKRVYQTDVYDVASLTKILASTLAVMKLVDQNKFDIDQTLGHYLPYLRGTEKGNIIIRELMAHQARFKSWIPFHRPTIANDSIRKIFYQPELVPTHTLKVADQMFILNSSRDSILKSITDTPLNKSKNYLYSDLGYYYLLEIIEKQSGKTLDRFVNDEFYQPLKLAYTMYRPLERIAPLRIAPTENDIIFRRQLIKGYVHDQGTAMLGGVAGHAGLFSTAQEVAVIMQMLLNGGEYKGQRYLNQATVAEFTRKQFPLNRNRRGLGFDKPLGGHQNGGPACSYASDRSFGHSGFTGTYAWADPSHELVYVFLSNRIHPDAENKKLQQLDIRTRIQAAIYEEIKRARS